MRFDNPPGAAAAEKEARRSRRHIRLPDMLLSTVSALALLSAPAVIHEPLEEPTELTEIVVTASLDPEDPMVARRARAELQETPCAEAVVAPEAYHEHLATDLGEPLHAVPGVYPQ